MQHSANKTSIIYDSLAMNDRRVLDLIEQKAFKADKHY